MKTRLLTKIVCALTFALTIGLSAGYAQAGLTLKGANTVPNFGVAQGDFKCSIVQDYYLTRTKWNALPLNRFQNQSFTWMNGLNGQVESLSNEYCKLKAELDSLKLLITDADSQAPATPNEFYFELEIPGMDGPIKGKSNSELVLNTVASQLCCITGNVKPKQEAPAKVKRTNRDDNESKFPLTFNVAYYPFNNSAFLAGGVSHRLGERLVVDGGLVIGQRTAKQTYERIQDGADVISTVHRYLGVQFGANYEIFNRVNAVASITSWGVDAKDFIFTGGGSYEVTKGANVFLAMSLGGQVKGLSTGFRFSF